MSRFNEYDGADGNWPYIRWAGAEKKARNGRPALKAFRELEAALVALPLPRLLGETFCADGAVCAVGAYVVHKRVLAGEERDAVLADLQARDLEGDETAREGADYGLTYTLAWVMGNENDDGYEGNGGLRDRYLMRALDSKSAEIVRYDRMLRWARSEIARLEAKFSQ